MKKETLLLIGFLLFFITEMISQTEADPIITFKYDASGNQIQRCFNCYTYNGKNGITKETEIIKATIEYFPNPVTDELKINWKNAQAKAIQVFDINGKLIATHPVNEKLNRITVPVKNYINGTYIIKILLNNNEVKSFKIIKI